MLFTFLFGTDIPRSQYKRSFTRLAPHNWWTLSKRVLDTVKIILHKHTTLSAAQSQLALYRPHTCERAGDPGRANESYWICSQASPRSAALHDTRRALEERCCPKQPIIKAYKSMILTIMQVADRTTLWNRKPPPLVNSMRKGLDPPQVLSSLTHIIPRHFSHQSMLRIFSGFNGGHFPHSTQVFSRQKGQRRSQINVLRP